LILAVLVLVSKGRSWIFLKTDRVSGRLFASYFLQIKNDSMSRPAPVNLRQRSHDSRCLRPTRAQRLMWQWIRHRCVVRCNRTWSRHHRPKTPLSRPFSAMSNSSLCVDLCPPCIVFQQLRPPWKESLATEASSCNPTGHAWVTLYSVTWCLLNAILNCKLDISQCLWSFW